MQSVKKENKASTFPRAHVFNPASPSQTQKLLNTRSINPAWSQSHRLGEKMANSRS